MQERIILAPGASASELLRSLARFGVNTLGLRITGSAGLARTALMRSGISIREEFLPPLEEAPLIFSYLKEIDYFSSASYADAEALAAALSSARRLLPFDEEEGLRTALARGEFMDKNDAIFEAYERYIAACKVHGRLDSIQLVRKALEERGTGLAGIEAVALG